MVETKQEKAERLAEFIRNLGSDFKIYMVIDGEYDHIGATIADAILQANRRYNLVVRPRVERILNNYAETQTTSAVVDLLRHVTISEFLDYRSERRTQRFS